MTSQHTRLPVYRGGYDNVVELLHVRKVLHLATEDITVERLLGIVRPPYFVPAGTPLFTNCRIFSGISAASPSWWMNAAR